MQADWWYENIVEPGKLPMLLCLGAFVVTFILTRVITRMIRAGIGPFKNNVSDSGLHIHHAVPGIILLIIGALMAIRGPESPWIEIAGVLIGIGTSLILDEFALILHLEDVYWTDEGRISVELIGLTAACIGFVMLGFSPLGVDDLTAGDLTVRITLITGIVIQGILVLICVLKAKYRAALISCFVPFVVLVLRVPAGPAGLLVVSSFLRGEAQGKGHQAGREVRPAMGSQGALAQRPDRRRTVAAGSAGHSGRQGGYRRTGITDLAATPTTARRSASIRPCRRSGRDDRHRPVRPQPVR